MADPDTTYPSLVIVWFVLHPLACYLVGKSAFCRIASLVGAKWAPPVDNPARSMPTFYILGLEIYTFLIFLFKCAHVTWVAAMLLPLLIVQWSHLRDLSWIFRFRVVLNLINPNFLLWSFVNFTLAGTLLYLGYGTLNTSWMNSYADFPFHAGIISSFAVGDNFPPEYQILPGNKLTYPYMVNVWTAEGVALTDITRWDVLGNIIAYQWVAVWVCIYFFLNGNRMFILPWALLFGGGTYYTMHKYSESVLHGEYPWAVFMTTIWAPQRSAPIGCAISLAALYHVHQFLNGNRPEVAILKKTDGDDVPASSIPSTNGNSPTADVPADAAKEAAPAPVPAVPKSTSVWNADVMLCALLGAFGPMWHAHISLFTVLYCGLVLALPILGQFKVKIQNRLLKIQLPHTRFSGLVSFVTCVIPPALMALPLLVSSRASRMVHIMYGWSHKDNLSRPVVDQITDSVQMWLKNGHAWLACMVVFFVFIRDRFRVLVLLSLFITANIVRLAPWNWDQFKVFIGLYMIFLSIWAFTSDKRFKVVFFLHLLCIVLTVPGAIEVDMVVNNPGEHHNNVPIFNSEDLQVAREIIEHTPADAIILTDDRHTNPVSLTGRRLFMGYEGWLWSHGLDYSYQKRITETPLRDIARTCRAMPIQAVCPHFLMWTHTEMSQWSNQKPGDSFQKLTDYVYRIPEHSEHYFETKRARHY